MRITSPLRTAYDLARRMPTDEAVVLADAIGLRHGLDPTALRSLAHRHPGVRGRRAVFPVADLVDPGSDSPGRTRVRLDVVRAGFDRPRAGVAVLDARGGTAGLLDLAWTDDRCGLQVLRGYDEALRRTGSLAELGWFVRLLPANCSGRYLELQVLGLLEQRHGRRTDWAELLARRPPKRRARGRAGA